MARNPTKKPRVLRRKNIKRRTSARAQSKQIVALSKQLSSLTKTSYETVYLTWHRDNISVDSLLPGGTSAYICPMPKSMCNCYEQPTIQNQALPVKRIGFSDNLALAAQPIYYKEPIFNASQAAKNSPTAHHVGGVLHWRMENTEPSFSTYSMFLISPKSRQADQLITDRTLKGFSSAGAGGAGAALVKDTDYITHPNIFGSQINRKYWNVDYQREVNFSHPGSTGFSNNVNPANTNPKNNAVVAQGKIRLKPGGVLRCFNTQENLVPGTDAQQQPISASQLGFIDEKNEKLQFLVVINNGVGADLETVNLSFIVKDTYKMVV